ncbi:MAG: exo-alpha-sialidase [Actinophytocola sp.]|nr:exo-alpha-sialidase [Actinophytocola sp.]
MRHSIAQRVLGVLTLGAALAACGDTEPAGPAEHAHVGLAHIHGLAVNPADGELYAGSHNGVFVVTGKSEPEQVAGRTQDFMGFTIIGPDHFLGSGHPGPDASGQPPHLGLIESTDGGETWRSLSLSGEADFHAMEAKHDTVYGFDSQTGKLLVSKDMRSWDQRAALPMADFAVSPDDADELLATTQDGVVRSTDGGRSFATDDAGPVLLLLDWASTKQLVGITPDGQVRTSADGGESWREAGSVPGSPQAITWHPDSGIYVATDQAIHRSTDDGATFDVYQQLG